MQQEQDEEPPAESTAKKNKNNWGDEIFLNLHLKLIFIQKEGKEKYELQSSNILFLRMSSMWEAKRGNIELSPFASGTSE